MDQLGLALVVAHGAHLGENGAAPGVELHGRVPATAVVGRPGRVDAPALVWVVNHDAGGGEAHDAAVLLAQAHDEGAEVGAFHPPAGIQARDGVERGAWDVAKAVPLYGDCDEPV